MITLTDAEFAERLEKEWKEGYRKGNLDGYFGTRDSYKEKFPNEDPYA